MTEQTNPLYVFTLWYKPGQTMQGLIQTGCGHRLALVVAMLYGLVQAMPLYLSEKMGSFVFLIGAVCGLIGLYLFSWLLRNFGRWFGAQAKVREVRTGLGLALMPWLLSFLLLFVFRQVFGAVAVAEYYWLFFVAFIYGYVVVILSLSVALRLTPLKTFFCLVVTIIVSLFPLTLLLQMLAPHFFTAQ